MLLARGECSRLVVAHAIAACLLSCRPMGMGTVMQPMPTVQVDLDAAGNIKSSGAALNRQQWQSMARASGWTDGKQLRSVVMKRLALAQTQTPRNSQPGSPGFPQHLDTVCSAAMGLDRCGQWQRHQTFSACMLTALCRTWPTSLLLTFGYNRLAGIDPWTLLCVLPAVVQICPPSGRCRMLLPAYSFEAGSCCSTASALAAARSSLLLIGAATRLPMLTAWLCAAAPVLIRCSLASQHNAL